ncbi:hypothetical protein GCK32_011025 [Trichostrongylus colubriformis]|uniref:Uncharacterized protein n=1 Tax=Trichostrongylus colubriformis TaxID=6319 RepID=A0AAN8FH76_TRICO
MGGRSGGGGGGGGGGSAGFGVVSHLGYALTPSLVPSAVASMPIAARRGSQNLRATTTTSTDTKSVGERPPTEPSSKHESLGDRASSKLTLDDELFDILYAFG